MLLLKPTARTVAAQPSPNYGQDFSCPITALWSAADPLREQTSGQISTAGNSFFAINWAKGQGPYGRETTQDIQSINVRIEFARMRPIVPPQSAFTMLAVFRLAVSASQNGGLTISNVNGESCTIGRNSAGNIVAQTLRANTIVTSDATYAPGQMIAAAYVIREGQQKLWVNGVEQSGAGTQSLSIFEERNTVAINPSDMGAILVVGFRGALSNTELQAITANPLLTIQPRRIWVPQTAAGGGTTYNQTVSGIFVPSGTLSQSLRFGASISGSVAPSGAVRKEVRVFRLGGLSPAGTLRKQTNKRPSGSITTSGSAAPSTGATQALGGSITLSGTLQQAARYLRSYSSVLTPSGTLRKMTLKGLSGSIAVAGQLAKGMFLRIAGSLAPIGGLSAFKFTPTVSNVISTTLRSIRRFIGRR